MSRLGPDVEAAQQQDEAWSLPRKVGYARQMLSLLRTLHEGCKMVFVDVKPGTYNFLQIMCNAVWSVWGGGGGGRRFHDRVR